jgi:predicted  nucleic acid-binding Zn-ribbon protein
MMKQQHTSQENHPIEATLTDLTGEVLNLWRLTRNLHKFIERQLGTAKDQQVKDQLTRIWERIQQHLPEMKTLHLFNFTVALRRNAWRKFLNGITAYKKLIEELNAQTGNQTKTQEDIKTQMEATKKIIEDAAKAFGDAITALKNTVGTLQTEANTLAQELQNWQSSAQQQEIASVIQQAISTIGDISNRINSIAQKLGDLETIFAQTQQEVEQLTQQEVKQPERDTTDSTSSPDSEEEPSDPASMLEDKIMNLYRAVVALEVLVNTATNNADIIPKRFVGIDTYTVSQGLRSINYKNLDACLIFLENYTGESRPSLLAALRSAKRENVAQPHFLKQQQAAPSYDIPEGIKIYLENFKEFLVRVRNHVRTKLDTILKDVSDLGNTIGQIPDIEEAMQAHKVASIPSFIILGTCASKLDDELSPSKVEAAASVLGAIIIAQSVWSSLLREDGWAEQVLQEITPQFQDPRIREGLHNIQVVLAHRRQEARHTPPLAAEVVGATVLGALSAFVQPAVKQLQQGAPSRKKKKFRRVLLITNTSLIREIARTAAEEKEIPSLTEGGIVKNTKEMINNLAKFMKNLWGKILLRITEDINKGRLSDPNGTIQRALDEVNKAWEALQKKMKNWKEDYTYNVGQEKKKIEEIKAELEALIKAWFQLLEAWKGAKKPKKGALDIEALLFHPLGLPALKTALTVLPTSVSGDTAVSEEGQTAKQEQKQEQKSEEEQLKREITTAIKFANQGQVGGAFEAVKRARATLRSQSQDAPPKHLQVVESKLIFAQSKLHQASPLDPKSGKFKANLQQAISLLQEALNALSNPTAGGTPYLGRNLLLLMKALHSMSITAQSHRREDKDEVIVEKETI